MARQDPQRREPGFSLIELMVAMTVTLIITGAVFKLVTAGQTAFRREPALADRQQNIRVAIDLISQDLYRAGSGLPEFAQALTDGLDGVGPAGSGGADADELEIFAAEECPALQVCKVSGTSMTTFATLSACYKLPALVLLANDTEWHPYWAELPGGGASSSCSGGGGGSNGHVVFPPGHSDYNNPGGPNHVFTNPPQWMLVGEVIRYRVNIDTDGTPNLERSAFGGNDYPDGSRLLADDRSRDRGPAGRVPERRRLAGRAGDDHVRRELLRPGSRRLRHDHPSRAGAALGAGDGGQPPRPGHERRRERRARPAEDGDRSPAGAGLPRPPARRGLSGQPIGPMDRTRGPGWTVCLSRGRPSPARMAS